MMELWLFIILKDLLHLCWQLTLIISILTILITIFISFLNDRFILEITWVHELLTLIFTHCFHSILSIFEFFNILILPSTITNVLSLCVYSIEIIFISSISFHSKTTQNLTLVNVAFCINESTHFIIVVRYSKANVHWIYNLVQVLNFALNSLFLISFKLTILRFSLFSYLVFILNKFPSLSKNHWIVNSVQHN